ncbi:glutamate-5-semialdehyde dehydrogenase [Aquibacillus salsiterrae]|uniref:Gamma-glutamyl phosphate reductase n=1 Tax=Aquibacillus salsiterrae TaxID=2950439 RepID=A0A9X3WDR2_9BACI|nr:glutamate-5-semialdehyde dehydrogenase [Aquibacillus salsiterrae]MDC3416250.1 glutamate-5-semialdehyde dehydrogenase [Aquibacillus salsiterrae]
MSDLLSKAQKVKAVATELGNKTTQQKDAALRLIAEQLRNNVKDIVEANQLDITNGKEKGFHESLIDRLIVNESRIHDMADALDQLTSLEDPIGEILESWERPNGLKINKVRVPLGVVGMIYEARPNVTVDAASLCLKTGNAVLLRGSSSALHSNKALVDVIHQALQKSDLPPDSVQLVEDTSRETASKLFKMNDYLDVLIPRGGKNLIQTVVEQSTVPVLETGAGNCHLFIDESADPEMAIPIVVNAKTQRPSVCNAIETVLVQKDWANKHLSSLTTALKDLDVELRGDERARNLDESIVPASAQDWETEFLDKILAVKVVESVEEAITHINKYGSKHSEGIVTTDDRHVVQFMNEVDAAALYHNASTRFTDGFEFGFGAEIGISTQKLHARGPMGLPALTSTKYLIYGEGQIK